MNEVKITSMESITNKEFEQCVPEEEDETGNVHPRNRKLITQKRLVRKDF